MATERYTANPKPRLTLMRPVNETSAGEAFGALAPGVRALAVAVLAEGIEDYLEGSGPTWAEVEKWVHTPGMRSPFAFDVLCEALGFEPDAVRSTLKTLRAERSSTPGRAKRMRPQGGRTKRSRLRAPGER